MNNELSADRFIDAADICNARQLGGYIGADGRRVRNGLLIRTAGLDKMTDETAKLLKISEPAVRTRLKRARNTLRKELEEVWQDE